MKQHIYKILILTFTVSCLGCQKSGDYLFDNVVYLNVAETKAAYPAVVGKKVAGKDYELHASLAYPSEQDVKVSIAVDQSKVDAYNSRNGTSWKMLDSRYFDFTEGEYTISAGKTASEVAVLHLKNLIGEGEKQEGALPEDETYLLPVSITGSSISLLQESSTVYYLVKRSSNITSAAQLGEDNWINFPTLDVYSDNSMVFNGLTAVTFEAFIYIDRFITMIKKPAGGEVDVAISSIMGKEQYFLFRIGDTKFLRQQLQFVGDAKGSPFGKMPRADARKCLDTGRWYHVACTYDQVTQMAYIYLDGKLQSEAKSGTVPPGEVLNLADRAFYDMWMNMSEEDKAANESKYSKLNEAYQFFIGKSYDDCRPLNGKIAEARVWSVARTQEEIYNNMYEIKDPETVPELIGYWKFDEGQGNVIRDHSRYGNDGVAEKDISWPVGIEIPKTH